MPQLNVHIRLRISALWSACLVLVHDVVLGQLVSAWRIYLRKQGLGGALLGGCAQGLLALRAVLMEQPVNGHFAFTV